MKIRTKLILFLSLLLSAFTIAFIFNVVIRQIELNFLFKEREKEENASFAKILELEKSRLESLAFNYAYGDEMVNFLKNQDRAWAESMIDKNVLSNYKVNAVWIYNPDFSFVYSVNNLNGEELNDLPLLGREMIKGLFQKGPFCHFFLNTPAGLMEIQGATIHPTSDPERKTPAQGYFFAGRLWDEAHSRGLSQLTTGSVTLAPVTEKEPRGSVHSGLIVVSRTLSDWNELPLRRLNVRIESKAIKYFGQSARYQTLLAFIFILGILTFEIFSITRWLNKPLKLLAKTLGTEELAHINGLAKERTEFGDISRLIYKFFEQRDHLSREIAERREAEEELRASEEKYRHLFENSQVGMYRSRIDGSAILEINEKWLKMFGYSKEEILGKPSAIIWAHPEKREPFIRQLKEKGVVIDYEMDILTKGGATRVCLVSSSIFPAEGVIEGAIIDITARKEAEQALREALERLRQTETQLVQSAKMASVGQLASGVAHEINNPLTGVLNNLQMLKAQLRQDKKLSLDDSMEVVDNMEESAQRCRNIIASLLEFARPAKQEFQPFSLNAVIEKALVFIENEMKEEEIFLQKQLHLNLPQVSGNPSLIQQAVLDIVSNARWAIQKKTKKETGLITLATHYEPRKNEVLLSISDNGIGIPKENRDKIFEPFFTTKPAGAGTGLGLFMVYSIIKEHRGAIEVESEVNKGTTFKITLPVLEKESRA